MPNINTNRNRMALAGVVFLIRNAEANAGAMGMNHNTGHLLLSIVQNQSPEACEYLETCNIDYDFVTEKLQEPGGLSESSGTFNSVIQSAISQTRNLGEQLVTPRVLLYAMLINSGCVAYKIIQASGADIANLKRDVYNRTPPSRQPGRQAGERAGPRGSALEEFGVDLTELARKGELDPLIGRGNEMDLLFSVLGRKHKNNPVLVGDAGVGKTAIVEGIAQKIIDGTAPEFLRDKKMFAISLTKVTAGTRLRGDFEERVKLLIEEIKSRPEVIIFIDELHMLAGAGSAVGGLDASNIMKPALARGDLRCIGATTMDEYRRYIEKDSALERRFQPITVDPPSAEETLEILKGLKDRYQQHHDVTYTDDALREAVILSERYRMDRRLPDSAIDLIDMAGGWAKQHRIKNITSTEIAQTLEKITRISVLTTKEEKERLQKCEETLSKRIIGCPRFCRVMHRIVNGMADLERPKAVIFLAGGTGLGKTYAAKEFHRFMFGSLKNLIELNMTEFTAPHTVARLIGAPPGYVGYDDAGQLTERVRRTPSTTILIDEIREAHPEVRKIFFQIFEEGRLTDSRGREARFNECFIFMTSNIQVNIEDGSGFGFSHRMAESPDVDDAIRQALKKEDFEDAFINRIDNFVLFTPFCNEDLGKIVDLMVADLLGGHLKGRELKFELAQDARKFLAKMGFSPKFGAKELRRAVGTELLSPLGNVIDSFKKGDTFVITLKQDGTGLEFSKKQQEGQQ